MLVTRRIGSAVLTVDSQERDSSFDSGTEPKPEWSGLRAAIRPVMTLSTIWGLAPCAIRLTGPPKPLGALYPTLVVIVLIVTQLYVAVLRYRILDTDSLYKVSFYIFFVMNRIFGLSQYVLLFIQRQKATAAFESVIAMDDEWQPVRNGRLMSIMLRVAIALFLSCTFVEAYLNFLHLLDILQWFDLAITLWCEWSISYCLYPLSLQWTPLVLSLAYHMDVIIESLTKLYPDSSSTSADEMPAKDRWMSVLVESEVGQAGRRTGHFEQSPSQFSRSILSLRRLHRSIHSALQDVQNFYGKVILIGVAQMCLGSVMIMYEFRYEFKLTRILWLLWRVYESFFTFTPCELLLEKTQKCADIIHATMQKDISADDRQQLLDFSIQLLDLPLRCTSCNLLDLNFATLVSIYGTVVTYVIILTQFDKSRQLRNTISVGYKKNCSEDNNGTLF